MLKRMGKNRKFICGLLTFGLLGLLGLLLVPIGRYIIKISKLHPKAFKWVTFATFVFLCIYVLLVRQKWNMSVLFMCVAVAIGRIRDTNSR